MEELLTPVGVHRAMVHFPIALLSMAVAFELIGRLFRKPALAATGYHLLYPGVAFGVLAVITGLMTKARLSGEPAAFMALVPRHEYAALTTAAVFLFALIWRALVVRDRGGVQAAIYVVALVFGAACVLGTGYLGGLLGHGDF